MSIATPIAHYHDLAVQQVYQDTEQVTDLNSDLTHEELVAEALLQILEERYQELNKEEKDAVLMMLIQNSSDLT